MRGDSVGSCCSFLPALAEWSSFASKRNSGMCTVQCQHGVLNPQRVYSSCFHKQLRYWDKWNTGIDSSLVSYWKTKHGSISVSYTSLHLQHFNSLNTQAYKSIKSLLTKLCIDYKCYVRSNKYCADSFFLLTSSHFIYYVAISTLFFVMFRFDLFI